MRSWELSQTYSRELDMPWVRNRRVRPNYNRIQSSRQPYLFDLLTIFIPVPGVRRSDCYSYHRLETGALGVLRSRIIRYNTGLGEMAERTKALVSKTSIGATLSWVRIPLSPPLVGMKTPLDLGFGGVSVLAIWRIFRQAVGGDPGKSTASLLGGHQVGTLRVVRGPSILSPSGSHCGQHFAQGFQRCLRVSARLRWGRDVARNIPTSASEPARTTQCNQLRGLPTRGQWR